MQSVAAGRLEELSGLGGDAEAADQALTFLALEGRIKKVHRASGPHQGTGYTIVGGEFGTELPVTVEPVDASPTASGVPNGAFPSAAGDLAHKLERALERIEELQERVERLERGGAEDRDAN